MAATKRPSTSSLRRYITSRPYVAVPELRRRFGLDPDAMSRLARNGTVAYVGLPEREAVKIQDLWERDEVGVEMSVEVHAPVVVGVYPMHIARHLVDYANGSSALNGSNGHAPNHGEPSLGHEGSHGPESADAPSPTTSHQSGHGHGSTAGRP